MNKLNVSDANHLVKIATVLLQFNVPLVLKDIGSIMNKVYVKIVRNISKTVADVLNLNVQNAQKDLHLMKTKDA